VRTTVNTGIQGNHALGAGWKRVKRPIVSLLSFPGIVHFQRKIALTLSCGWCGCALNSLQLHAFLSRLTPLSLPRMPDYLVSVFGLFNQETCERHFATLNTLVTHTDTRKLRLCRSHRQNEIISFCPHRGIGSSQPIGAPVSPTYSLRVCTKFTL
jgi:hypothetical protein